MKPLFLLAALTTALFSLSACVEYHHPSHRVVYEHRGHHDDRLPPGLAKKGKCPPGHAKKGNC